MSIEFNNNNKIFSLKTKNTSYILRVLESGHLGHFIGEESLIIITLNMFIKEKIEEVF